MILTLKLISVFGIVVGCTYLGILKSSTYIKREKFIREFTIFFGRLKSDILYTQNTVPNLIEQNRQDLDIEIKDVLGNISTDMLINPSAFSIEQSIENNIDRIKQLEEIDKNYIKKGLKGLGKSDSDGQQNLIENTIKLLDFQIVDATDKKNKNSKLYKNLGMLVGMFLAVVFI